MPQDSIRSSIGSLLAAGARRVLGRLDGAVSSATRFEPVVESIAPVRMDAAGRSVLDCGPGGCGGGGFGGAGGGWAWSGVGPLGITPSLDRASIDDAMTDELMRRIVYILVEDALEVQPSLAGETGELSGCIDWLNERGYWAEMARALQYSRMYGGGGVVCIVDDGRRSDEEVDVLAIRDVKGFYALPKWYLVPDGVGSGRVGTSWYGARIGRPEHYFVTPNTALATYVVKDPKGSASTTLPSDLRAVLAKGGNRFHRSRVIAWPYRDEMDLRLARWMPQWNGWGPGVVESVLAPFMARRQGALRLAAIMNSVVVNTMTIDDLEARQSQPDLFALLQARLEFVKWCRDFMSDSLPVIATDTKNKFSSLTHNVSGIDKLVEAQRQYLLDVVDMPAVRLFGDSVGGLNGGDRNGEWRSWAATVKAKQSTWVWTAGSFGGGLKQAVSLAMLCQRGPTDGQLDRTVKATWPSILSENADDLATTRLKNAQARAQDALVLGLTSAALLRHDPTVKESYPSLDVDEGPLPELGPPTPGPARPEGAVPAVAGPAAGEGPVTAATPGATNEALAKQQEGEPPAGQATDESTAAATTQPLVLPSDIRTEKEVAAALAMSQASFRTWVENAKVTTYPTPAGTRGGHRYSLSEVLRAWQAAAIRRADAAAI